MSSKKFFWKVWLRLNFLTKDVENDYIAEVSTVGKTLRNEDVAAAIKEEGAEWQVESILDLLNRADRIRRHRVCEGYSVLTGLCHVSPRVSGNWIGASTAYDPAAHKITCDMSPAAELRANLEEVGVEVLGIKESGAFIGLVTDAATGKTDGNITAGDDIIIEGDKIKIEPEGETGIGIFFVSATGTPAAVTHRLLQNGPKKVIARIPAVAAGAYTLKIVTRYTSGSNTLLKESREIEYAIPLIVG
ncbi:hypothetical protein FACS189452_10440 [Bacteroidia bacterium]|nr:hypothetical protein FACS189452_10440 [Bacteroidia bacterium]